MFIFKTNFICLETKSFLDDASQLSFFIQNPCTIMWVSDFWCRTVISRNPDTFTAFHRWGLRLTIIGRSFTQWGIYPLLMPLHVISSHMHNECYMDNSTHAYHQCIMDNYIYMHIIFIHHFIHVNISCKHISTFTFNMSFCYHVMAHT